MEAIGSWYRGELLYNATRDVETVEWAEHSSELKPDIRTINSINTKYNRPCGESYTTELAQLSQHKHTCRESDTCASSRRHRSKTYTQLAKCTEQTSRARRYRTSRVTQVTRAILSILNCAARVGKHTSNFKGE